MKNIFVVILLYGLFSAVAAQSADAYSSSTDSKKGGFLDPNRLLISHSMSFGMMSNSISRTISSDLQSQSFYSTLMQYKFVAPVTLNLNFSLPIHSTSSPYQNLSSTNLQSSDYFKSIPFEASLSWKPTERLLFNFRIVNNPAYDFYGSRYSPFHSPFSLFQ